MAEAGGIVKPGFEKVMDAFRKNLDKGLENGGSFAAYYKGELVVHIWGGLCDTEQKRAWEKDTLGNLFSTTKALAAIVIAHLVDRGLLAYEEKVSQYWPEFAKNGKEDVTLRQLMTHTAGLVNIDGEWNLSDMANDLDGLEERLAAQEPYWEPGTRCGYHALTIGLYVNAIVKRVDPNKRQLGQYFKEEFAEPFGLDLHIGLPKDLAEKVTRLEIWKQAGMSLENMYEEILERADKQVVERSRASESPKDLQDIFNIMKPEMRSLPDGSAGGMGTAEGLAKIFGILSNGGELNGKRMLSEEVIGKLETPSFTDHDAHVGIRAQRGMGTWIFSAVENMDFENPIYMFGHPGAGGQHGYGERRHNVGWAYTSNFLNFIMDKLDPRVAPLLNALYECIHDKEGKNTTTEIYVNQTEFESKLEQSRNK